MQKQFDDYFGRRGAVLLVWLVIGVTLASPLADTNPHVGAALALILLFSVLMGARLSANKKIMMRAVLPLSGLWVLARELEGLSSDPYAFSFLAHVVGLAFTCMILWAIYECIQASQVTSAVIAEALVSYLIIAIGFAQLYWILNELVTDSFNQKLPPRQSSTFLYFSMVTLTSVGYGGIVPVNPYVRLIAAFESMTGIFYVAIVVARLVSAYRSGREPERQPD